MSDWVWVPLALIRVVHDRQISRHGGSPGVRDTALLEMGNARAMNRAAYDNPDPFDIAAAYAFGLVKAHAFVDGNKRTGFVTAITFLRLNGFGFRPDPADGVRMMEGLASGALSEDAFADWLRSGASRLEPATDW